MKKRKIKKGRLLILGILMLSLCIGLPYGLFRFFNRFKPIDEQAFVFQDGIMSYQDPDVHTMTGIDVSSYQGKIDWKAVKEDGIEFVMIRCGFRDALTGELFDDPMFEENVEGALKQGLQVGVYFFSAACNQEELFEEANFVIDRIKPYAITMPVAYDMELFQGDQGRIIDLSPNEKTQLVLTFCEKIKKAGADPMIYGNESWLTQQIVYEEIQEIPIWYAAYRDVPNTQIDFKMWQYSEQGSVNGISGPVDMNILFTDA